jgi:hypothetical protein
MTARDRAFVDDIKKLIDKGDIEALKDYYQMILLSDLEVAPQWDYIYQKCYLHACLKHQHVIADWFRQMFNQLDTISQIALKQIFAYGNYLERKNNPYLK